MATVGSRDEAERVLRASPLFAAHGERLFELLRAGAQLKVGAANTPASRSIGASRIGGDPDLPPGTAWPTWEFERRYGFLWRKRRTEVRALDFLLQLRLEDLPESSFPPEAPRKGMLWFFVDQDEFPIVDESSDVGDGQGYRVLFDDRATELVRREPPGPRSDWWRDPHELIATPAWTLSEDAEFVVDRDEYFEGLLPRLEVEGVDHRVFGHVCSVQHGGVTRWTAGKDAESVLLLQLDSSDHWLCGRTYFTIRRDAIVRRDFAKALMTWDRY